MSVGVIGAGKWGSALHFALSKNREVLITSRKKRVMNWLQIFTT